MYKDALQSIENVTIWPIISLIIFVAFFLMVIWWALRADESFLAEMSNKPLEDDDREKPNQYKTTRL